jgi:hypothetical protein
VRPARDQEVADTNNFLSLTLQLTFMHLVTGDEGKWITYYSCLNLLGHIIVSHPRSRQLFQTTSIKFIAESALLHVPEGTLADLFLPTMLLFPYYIRSEFNL